jgi:hypothetical protein
MTTSPSVAFVVIVTSPPFASASYAAWSVVPLPAIEPVQVRFPDASMEQPVEPLPPTRSIVSAEASTKMPFASASVSTRKS